MITSTLSDISVSYRGLGALGFPTPSPLKLFHVHVYIALFSHSNSTRFPTWLPQKPWFFFPLLPVVHTHTHNYIHIIICIRDRIWEKAAHCPFSKNKYCGLLLSHGLETWYGCSSNILPHTHWKCRDPATFGVGRVAVHIASGPNRPFYVSVQASGTSGKKIASTLKCWVCLVERLKCL